MARPESDGIAYPETDAFFRAAAFDPNRPIDRVAKEKPRDALLTGVYFSVPGSLRDIGNTYGMTRANASLIIRKTVDAIWHYSSQKTQGRFPQEQIPTNKPHSADRRLYRLRKTNRYQIIFDNLDKASSFDVFQQATGFTSKELTNIRSVLKQFNINIPKSYDRILRAERVHQIQQATDEELDDLVPKLPMPFVMEYTKGKPKLFATLDEIAQGYKGVTRYGKQYAAALREAGIPEHVYAHRIHQGKLAGKILYYYHYPNRMIEKARGVLDAAPNLVQFRK